MKALYTLIILLVPFLGFGQGWEQIYGGASNDFGLSCKQTSDGGYVITGRTYSENSDFDVILIKTNENGLEEWIKTFGETNNINGYNQDLANSILLTSNNEYVITGKSHFIDTSEFITNLASDVYLLKTDENGSLQWKKKLGELYNDAGYCIQETYDNGYIITGTTQDYAGVSTGTRDLLLMKTDINGNEQWVKTFGGTSNDFGFSVQQTIDGGFIITGYTESYGQGERDILLIKTDINGNEQWMKTFGSLYSDEGNSVQQTTDGGYIITGYKEDVDKLVIDLVLIKTNENGDSLWSKTFDDGYIGKSIQLIDDGGFIITGGATDGGVFLLKTDENGDELWHQTYDIGNYAEDVQQTTDGGFVITGTTYYGINLQNVFLIKTDENGNTTSTFEIPLLNPNRKLEKTINLQGQEVKPQTNQPVIEIYNDGSVEKKVIIE